VPVPSFQATSGDDINPDSKKVHEVVPQLDEVEQRGILVELNEKIEIAAIVLLAPRHGTKERDGSAVMAKRTLRDLAPTLDDNLAKRTHAPNASGRVRRRRLPVLPRDAPSSDVISRPVEGRPP